MEEVKFNSLFDNEIENPKNSDFYTVDNNDNILGLTELVLNFDEQNIEENLTLHKRNFFNFQDMILSGRPCSTSACNPHNKFCDSGGIPEYVSKDNVDNITNKISKNVDKDSIMRKALDRNSCKGIIQQKNQNERLNKINVFCNSKINPNFFQPTKRINLNTNFNNF